MTIVYIPAAVIAAAVVVFVQFGRPSKSGVLKGWWSGRGTVVPIVPTMVRVVVTGVGAVVLFFFGEFGEAFVEDWGWATGWITRWCGVALAAFAGCLSSRRLSLR